MQQKSKYSRTKDEKLAIICGFLIIAIMLFGAWLFPPMPGEALLLAVAFMLYGITGPKLRRRQDLRNRRQARYDRQAEKFRRETFFINPQDF